VTVNDSLVGLDAVQSAEENGDLNLIPSRNGFKILIQKGGERQAFRIQIVDLNAICLTEVNSHPVVYDEKSTKGFVRSGKTNGDSFHRRWEFKLSTNEQGKEHGRISRNETPTHQGKNACPRCGRFRRKKR